MKQVMSSLPPPARCVQYASIFISFYYPIRTVLSNFKHPTVLRTSCPTPNFLPTSELPILPTDGSPREQAIPSGRVLHRIKATSIVHGRTLLNSYLFPPCIFHGLLITLGSGHLSARYVPHIMLYHACPSNLYIHRIQSTCSSHLSAPTCCGWRGSFARVEQPHTRSSMALTDCPWLAFAPAVGCKAWLVVK